MGKIQFYYTPGSAPCRNVMLTAAALGIDMGMKLLDLMKGEHMSPEFLKINPIHTVPTIDDNGFRLWESRPIMTYLANKYEKGDSLYPKDPQKRAIVDQLLSFDSSTLYQNFASYMYPMLFAKAPRNEDNYKKVVIGLENLDKMIAGRKYAAGDHLTLADLALVSTVSTIESAGFEVKPHGHVAAWYDLVKKTAPKYDEMNAKPLQSFVQLMKNMLP